MPKLSELVSGLGSGGDDAPRWMAAVKKAGPGAGIYLDPLEYTFKTPCVLSQLRGARLWSDCSPFPDGEGGPRVMWAGSTGERVFYFDRCNSSGLEGVSVEMDPAGTAYTAVDFDNEGDGESTSNFLRRVRFHAKHDNDNYLMVSIARNTNANHEYYDFEDVRISGGDGPTTANGGVSRGVGLKIWNSQSKMHCFRKFQMWNLNTAIWQVQGSFDGQHLSFTNNEVDVRIDDGTEPTTLHMNSELARRALLIRSGYPVTVLPGSRFGPQRGADGYITAGWIFSLTGSQFDGMPAAGNRLFDFSQRGRWAEVRNNRFPDTTVAAAGLDSMPADRTILLANNDGLKDAPAELWVRGGRVRAEFSSSTDAEIFQAVGHKLSPNARIAPIVSHFDV